MNLLQNFQLAVIEYLYLVGLQCYTYSILLAVSLTLINHYL